MHEFAEFVDRVAMLFRSGELMTATAPTFYIKSEIAEGSLDCIPCLNPRQVFENLEDERENGAEGMG